MRYENVAVLVEGIEDIINAMLYCWVDKEGVICRQNGIFRVNCIDCLDRTNVVQVSLRKTIHRLGIRISLALSLLSFSLVGEGIGELKKLFNLSRE